MEDITKIWRAAKCAATNELRGVWGTDAEDIAQDLAVMEIERCAQTPWKAKMLAKDRKRSESRRRVLETKVFSNNARSLEDGSILDSLVDAEQQEAVAAAVDSLPPIEQAIIRARYWDGLSVEEIARRVGLGRKPVVRVLKESLKAIKESLK